MSSCKRASTNDAEVRYWNSPATQSWNEIYPRIDAFFAPLTAAALRIAAPRLGECCVDIGCGSGSTVLDLAAAVGVNGYVLGLDVSAQSVAAARARIDSLHLKQAEVILADVSSHVFPPHQFDLAFSRFGVMFFADPSATFANVHGAMKKGGRLALAVFRSAQENEWASAPFAAVRDALSATAPSAPDAPGMFSWASPDRVRRVFENSGFQDVTLTPLDLPLKLADHGRAIDAAEFIPNIGPLLRALSTATDEQRAETRQRLIGFFDKLDGASGIFLQGAFWLISARA